MHTVLCEFELTRTGEWYCRGLNLVSIIYLINVVEKAIIIITAICLC